MLAELGMVGQAATQYYYECSRQQFGTIAKETVGNSWDILYAVLGHKYHNHSDRVISTLVIIYNWNEANICNKNYFGSVCEWVNLQYTIDCFADMSRKRARFT